MIQLQLLLFNNMHAFRVYFLSTEHNEGPEKGFYFQIRLNHLSVFIKTSNSNLEVIVKLRQGSGKEGQGMALKAKGLEAQTLA